MAGQQRHRGGGPLREVALVTGASRGIGRAIAMKLAERGASVAVAARTTSDLSAVEKEIRSAGGIAVSIPVDVADPESVRALVDSVRRRLGPATVLVNNAGIHQPKPFLEYSLEEWRRMFDVNVIGTVTVSRAVLPEMIEAGHGRIINIASTAGKYGSLFQSPYNATKHAVVGLTRCLALETAASGVRVNAVCPGFVDTELIDRAVPGLARAMGVAEEEVVPTLVDKIPIGRFVEPREVAELVAYLAGPEADAVTGQALTISGGMLLI